MVMQDLFKEEFNAYQDIVNELGPIISQALKEVQAARCGTCSKLIKGVCNATNQKPRKEILYFKNECKEYLSE